MLGFFVFKTELLKLNNLAKNQIHYDKINLANIKTKIWVTLAKGEDMEKEELEKQEEFNKKQEMYRHSMAHVLAKAIKELYPNVKLAIGPAIDNGFYYDFDNLTINQDDFAKIEDKMKEIIARNEDFVRSEVSRDEALKMFANEPYKTELINDLPADSIISVYHTGSDF